MTKTKAPSGSFKIEHYYYHKSINPRMGDYSRWDTVSTIRFATDAEAQAAGQEWVTNHRRHHALVGEPDETATFRVIQSNDAPNYPVQPPVTVKPSKRVGTKVLKTALALAIIWALIYTFPFSLEVFGITALVVAAIIAFDEMFDTVTTAKVRKS